MSKYPKLIYTCEGDGIWILGPGPNPPAEIRNRKGERLTPLGLTMASIAGHTDLRDWDEVVEPHPLVQSNEMADQSGQARGNSVSGESDPISHRRGGAASEFGRGTTKMAVKTKSKATKNTRGGKKGKMELVPRTLAELPIMLMGRLYYRPHGGIRRTLTPKEEMLRAEAGVNNYRFLRDNVWSAEETVVNKCLEGLLMAVPPAAVGAAINAVAPSSGLASPLICKLRYPKQLNRVVGEPDFLLWDASSSALVIGEIKIGAKSSNGRYSDEQLKKYMRLGLLAQGSLGIKHVTHLIVLPSMDIEKHCTNVDYWKPAVGPDGRLIERAKRFATTMVDYGIVVSDCARHLESFDAELVQECLDPKNPLIPIDTFVTSWQALCDRLTEACIAQHAGHLKDSLRVLQRLGEGRFAAESTGGPD